MSIASQLTALEGNISDAYDMVAQRGGTVPARKNMENLDDAIATIPSGGGSAPTTPTLTSATLSNGVITLTGTDFGSSPKVLMFNRKYDRYDAITPTTSSSTSATVPVGASDYGIFSRVVKIENGGYESGVKFVYDDFENLASTYDVIVWCYGDNPNKTPLEPYGGPIAEFCNTGSATASSYFNTQYGTVYGTYKVSDGTSATTLSYVIRGAEVSTSLTAIASGFLGYCGVFNQPLGLANVTETGTPGTAATIKPFLGGAYSFNSPIDTSKIEIFGNGFLKFCSSFNQPLDLSSATTIGTHFLSFCESYDQPLSFSGSQSAHLTIMGNMMQNCVSMSKPVTYNYCDTTKPMMYNCASLPCINVYSTTITGGDNTSFCVSSYLVIGAPSFNQGVYVNGDSTSVDAWINALPDSSGGNNNRKMVRGTVTS